MQTLVIDLLIILSAVLIVTILPILFFPGCSSRIRPSHYCNGRKLSSLLLATIVVVSGPNLLADIARHLLRCWCRYLFCQRLQNCCTFFWMIWNLFDLFIVIFCRSGARGTENESPIRKWLNVREVRSQEPLRSDDNRLKEWELRTISTCIKTVCNSLYISITSIIRFRWIFADLIKLSLFRRNYVISKFLSLFEMNLLNSNNSFRVLIKLIPL